MATLACWNAPMNSFSDLKRAWAEINTLKTTPVITTKISVATINSSKEKPAFRTEGGLGGAVILTFRLFLNGGIQIHWLIECILRRLPDADQKALGGGTCAIQGGDDRPAHIVAGALRIVRIHVSHAVAGDLVCREIDRGCAGSQRATCHCAGIGQVTQSDGVAILIW